MQVYRYFDIGTAKPSKEEQLLVRHHLIDIADPDESYNAAQFATDVGRIVPEIVGRGRIPILAGGTGLYIRAAVTGFLFPSPGRDEQYRRTLEQEAEECGNEYLWEKLRRVDPVSAARIHGNDLVRIIRALEVYQQSGLPVSQQAERGPQGGSERYDCLMVCLNRDRTELYERINRRVDQMIENGLVEEARKLYPKRHLNSLNTVGYKELFDYFDGNCTLDFAIGKIKQHSRNYARKQMTWFKRDKEINWIDLSNNKLDAVEKSIHLISQCNRMGKKTDG